MRNGNNQQNKLIIKQDKHHLLEEVVKIIKEIDAPLFLPERKITKDSCSLFITAQEIQTFGKKIKWKTVLQTKKNKK